MPSKRTWLVGRQPFRYFIDSSTDPIASSNFVRNSETGCGGMNLTACESLRCECRWATIVEPFGLSNAGDERINITTTKEAQARMTQCLSCIITSHEFDKLPLQQLWQKRVPKAWSFE